MKYLTLFRSAILIGAVVAVFLGGAVVFAQQGHDDVDFPIPELGNCESEQECIAYCNIPENFEGCLVFVVENNIISPEEARLAREYGGFQEIDGPGRCSTQQECELYCEDTANIDECLSFAEEHGLMEGEELEEARKVQRALAGGAQLPGGCRNKFECEAYCEDINNIDECLAFAEAAGFMHPGELEEARKVQRALASGAQLPGGCRNQFECEAYCEDPSHMEECFAFAEAAGLIPEHELEEARKFMPLMAAGKMPGGCTSRHECEAYCSQDGNFEECATVFESIGVISPEEARMLRKTGGKGPGGCRGERECEAFCNDSANQQECFAFASEHGLIPPEELEHMKEGIRQFREGFESAPPEVA
ncbi:MAG: hypothetical protein QF775_00145, partial [archaeon]|nr:hypothetical protein [archaeon]